MHWDRATFRDEAYRKPSHSLTCEIYHTFTRMDFTAERSEVRKRGFSAISQFALRPEVCSGAAKRNAALRLQLQKLYAWIKCKVFTLLFAWLWEKHTHSDSTAVDFLPIRSRRLTRLSTSARDVALCSEPEVTSSLSAMTEEKVMIFYRKSETQKKNRNKEKKEKNKQQLWKKKNPQDKQWPKKKINK